MAFDVPEFGADFIDRVARRVDCLITLNLWDIPKDRFEGWISQFHTGQERFFASCVLDSLIYRSKRQFVAASEALYRGELARELRAHLKSNSDVALINALRGRSDPGIRLVPVIKKNDPPTKSGPLVLRIIQKHFGIIDRWTIWPWEIDHALTKEHVKAIVFVDDFLGSGDQFDEFLRNQNLPTNHTNVTWLYAPVMASHEGMEKLRPMQPHVLVVAAEVLQGFHKFFSADNWQLLTNGKISETDARKFYEDLLRARNLPFTGHEYGHSDMELCVGFEHSSPDNSLPILWHQDSLWNSLFDPRL